jgi:ADP-heptose:LPS heptosyltransferase
MPASTLTNDNPRVLIIRPTALGDVSRTVPALVTLRNAMPHAQIDWLVRGQFADVIRHHPALNHIVEFDRDKLGRPTPQGITHLRQWSRRLRQGRYDITIDLQGLARSGGFSWLTRAPRRIGYANAREFGWLGYTERHHVDASLHAVDRMLGLMHAAGFEPSHDMSLYVGDADRQWWDAWLREQGIAEVQSRTSGGMGGQFDGGTGVSPVIDASRRTSTDSAADGRPTGGTPVPPIRSTTQGSDAADYFVLAPTARWRCKCWPLERYTEVGRRLLDSREAGSHLIVIASPGEQAYIQPLLDALGPTGRVHCPPTTVGRMMAVLQRAGLLVCNDSAPLHIAVGLDRRIVTIFGPTDPSLVGPYRRENTIVQPPDIQAMGPRAYRQHRDDQSLISQVTLDAVWQRVSGTLDMS